MISVNQNKTFFSVSQLDYFYKKLKERNFKNSSISELKILWIAKWIPMIYLVITHLISLFGV
jgi:hypothetical protein